MSLAQVTHAAQTCAWCSGAGTRAISLGHVISCLVCGGKGKVSIAQPAEPCRQCGGSGRRSEINSCLTCAGTGWGRVFAQG